MKEREKAAWSMLLTAVLVVSGGNVLWAAELPTKYRRCPDVQGKEYAEMNVPRDDRDTFLWKADLHGFKCERVTWKLEFEDPYGGVTHFECDGRWTFRWPADQTGFRPIPRAHACYTGY